MPIMLYKPFNCQYIEHFGRRATRNTYTGTAVLAGPPVKATSTVPRRKRLFHASIVMAFRRVVPAQDVQLLAALVLEDCEGENVLRQLRHHLSLAASKKNGHLA
jgi:hypothetical protein